MTLAVKHWDPKAGPLQLTTLRRQLEAEGMVTAWWSDMPGTSVPAHAHEFAETRWVLSGFLSVTMAGETVQLGPGDRLDVPKGATHTTEVVGLAPVVYVTGTPERAVAERR